MRLIFVNAVLGSYERPPIFSVLLLVVGPQPKG